MSTHRWTSSLTICLLALLLPIETNGQPSGSIPAKAKGSVSGASSTLQLANGNQVASKRSSRDATDSSSGEASREKPQGTVAKTDAENLRAGNQANDYWTTCFGGFHLFGNDARAVYRYPAQPNGTGYDTHWVFVDDLPVGNRAGWTYKEDGYNFFMFFARNADSNGKFWVASSTDNSDFDFYAWAD